ncbi:MAG: hypothetical protein SGJ20_15505 [Planctomycetota bacterium]|nr:hypothetical protein [Planctomycetota bacterium]
MIRLVCCCMLFFVLTGYWMTSRAADEGARPNGIFSSPGSSQPQPILPDAPPAPAPIIQHRKPARAGTSSFPSIAAAPFEAPSAAAISLSPPAESKETTTESAVPRTAFATKDSSDALKTQNETGEKPGEDPEVETATESVDESSGDIEADIEEQARLSSFSPEQLALRKRIHNALGIYSTKHLNTRDNTPWEIMHAFVAYNIPTTIRRDGPSGQEINAIGWLLWGGRCQGQTILTTINGRPYAQIGPGVQGHPAQLLAILAQSRVSAKTPMLLDGKNFTLQDLIDEEKLDCRANTELTFKLISLAHYLPTDSVWKSRDGQDWSIPRLIGEEIRQPIRGAACGGTHRLFGLSYAYKMRLKRGEPVTGEYLRAQKYIEDYHRYADSLQNSDGSFSTEWFARRGDRQDLDRKIQTTGHILEWLVFSMTDEQLREPDTVRAVNFIASNLQQNPDRVWSIGPLGHALHALMMYDERVFQKPRQPAALAKDDAPKPSTAPEVPGESEPEGLPENSATDVSSEPKEKAAFRPEEATDNIEGPRF